VLERGVVPLILGGDDSIPIPALRAFADRGPLHVLQVDAHLDFRDEVDGVRDGYSSPMRRAAEMAHVERILQVGLRGVGSARPGDVVDARSAGNVLVTARQLHRHGVPWLLEQVPADASVFLSFDLDGLDPSIMAAVSAPAPGGLGWDQAVELVHGIGPRIAGAAFTEYVPAVDGTGIGALVAVRLAALLVGGVGAKRQG
jgi:agmatinase